jgi:hypothetical protein
MPHITAWVFIIAVVVGVAALIVVAVLDRRRR